MMKTFLLSLLSILLLSGCTEYHEKDVVPSTTVYKDLTASFEEQTRTYVEDELYLRWHKDDRLSVFFGNTLNSQYKFEGETGDNSGTFSKLPDDHLSTGNSLPSIYALYPYNDDSKISDKGVITAYLPAIQQYAGNTFAQNANTMVAVTKNTDDLFLSFKNVCGFLTLSLHGQGVIGSAMLTGNSAEKISGKATITSQYGQIPTVEMNSDATDVIAIDFGQSGLKLSSQDSVVWFVVPPTTFKNGITITLYDTAGNEVYSKSTQKQVVVERNIILPMASIEVNVQTPAEADWIDLGECFYTDDIITSWWAFTFNGAWAGMTHPTYKVKVQVRADSINEAAFQAALAGTGSDAGLAGVYRLVNAYRVGPWGDPSDPSLETDPVYTTIYANPYNRAYIPLQELGISINDGASSIYSMAGYLIDSGAEADITEDMYGSFVNGALRFPVQALLGCPGGEYIGRFYYTNSDGAFRLIVAPELYYLDYFDDFSYQTVSLPEQMKFYSSYLNKELVANLEKGSSIFGPDFAANKKFEEKWGTIYRLTDLYQEGYDILFAVKDGKVNPLVSSQPIGLHINGGYIKMNIIDGVFNEQTNELSLNVQFINPSMEGDQKVINCTEVLSLTAPEGFGSELDFANDFVFTEWKTFKVQSSILSGVESVTVNIGNAKTQAIQDQFDRQYKDVYSISGIYDANSTLYFMVDIYDNVCSYSQHLDFINGDLVVTSGSVSEDKIKLNITLTLSDGTVYTSTEILSNEANDWTTVSTGTYDSVFGAINDELQYSESTNLYRIHNWLGSDGNLVFKWDQSSNLLEIVGLCDTGISASEFGGEGRIAVCDAKGFFDWVAPNEGYGWDILTQVGYRQPYYNPTNSTFYFDVFYCAIDMGVGVMLNENQDGMPIPFSEQFALQSGSTSDATWNQVATGSYSTIFQDQNGDQFIVPGVKMENKEGSNLYRLYDPWYNEGNYYLNFAWDQQTNLVDIIGFNDSGNPSDIFGAPANAGNAMICDVLTFYTQMLGQSVTWADLKSLYGEIIQSAYDPATATFSFVVCYAFPELGAIVNDSFFIETYTIDSSAAPAYIARPTMTKVSSKAIPIVQLSTKVAKKIGSKPTKGKKLTIQHYNFTKLR